MTKDEILKAVRILKSLPIVNECFTAEIGGSWVDLIGVELTNGDYVKFENMEEVYAFAFGFENDRKKIMIKYQ